MSRRIRRLHEVCATGGYQSPSSPIASTGQDDFASSHCADSSAFSGCLYT